MDQESQEAGSGPVGLRDLAVAKSSSRLALRETRRMIDSEDLTVT